MDAQNLAAALAFLLYDTIISFDDEVNCIWRRLVDTFRPSTFQAVTMSQVSSKTNPNTLLLL